MSEFDKHMATEVIEDAFMDLDSLYGRGVVSGLCGAFYMCGLLTEEEWKSYLKRIPPDCKVAGGLLSKAMPPAGAHGGQLLN